MNFDDLEIDLLPSPIHEKQTKSKYQRQRIPTKKSLPRQGKIKRGRPRSSKRQEQQLENKRNTDSPEVLIIENSPPKAKTPKNHVQKLPTKKNKSSRSSSKQQVPPQPQSLETHRVKIATFNLEQIIGQWQLNLKKMLDSSVNIMNQLKANK